jgi:ankyrin repeat protein
MERERRAAVRKGCEQLAAEFLTAVRAGDVAEVARLLAETDVDPNGGDPRPTADRPTSGATALHIAAQRNHTAMMDALVAAGSSFFAFFRAFPMCFSCFAHVWTEVAIRHRLGEIQLQQGELLASRNEKVAAAKDAKEAGELSEFTSYPLVACDA